jgi:hypothetical protein
MVATVITVAASAVTAERAGKNTEDCHLKSAVCGTERH